MKQILLNKITEFNGKIGRAKKNEMKCIYKGKVEAYTDILSYIIELESNKNCSFFKKFEACSFFTDKNCGDKCCVKIWFLIFFNEK